VEQHYRSDGKEILKEKGHSRLPMYIYHSLTDNAAINENTIYPLNFPNWNKKPNQ
jgi:hypothetical protein